jgi:glycosyltransferase involved in cell wall biosynthesis
MLNKKIYVLITAARNEEVYIEKTILSVTHQTISPARWVIVSDGSTDKTDDIAEKYAKQYSFMQVLRIRGDNRRNFGSQVRAINIGYEQLKDIRYEFIGNLDADISFDDDYYERILEKFQQNQRLGLAGGFIYEEHKGKFKGRKFNNINSVPHAIQIFRRQCFELIGGYIPLPYGGPDWVAEVTARMNGWEVKALPELKVFHHRPTATADGVLRGKFRQGLMDYSVGSHPVFEIFKCIHRIKGRPYFIGSLLRLLGFVCGYFRRENRTVSNEFIRYLRKEQTLRIKSLFSSLSPKPPQ